MIIYPVREGLNFVLNYIRRDAFCKTCGKNEAWARQRLNRYKHNNNNDFYYFSPQDCELINESLPKIADELEFHVRIPNSHTPYNAMTVRDEIESLIKIVRVQNLQKELGLNRARWHDGTTASATRTTDTFSSPKNSATCARQLKKFQAYSETYK